ncbi:hypothetical protein [Rossellomorea aquimaris]|uniref:hypothetical protein n=1 Tax=Rossellomorea aquimaris TaxID=189382 RepID=UPI0007D08F4D|nr:hypothetical protein [Rossellomorea aquimaris]
MYLFLSMILSAILGFALLMMGPVVGGLIAFGIVVGSIFRGLYLLSEIHKGLAVLPEEEKTEEPPHQNHMKNAVAYKKYLEEKNG